MVFLQCVQNVVRFSLYRKSRCCCCFRFEKIFSFVKHIFRIVFNVWAPLGVRVAWYLFWLKYYIERRLWRDRDLSFYSYFRVLRSFGVARTRRYLMGLKKRCSTKNLHIVFIDRTFFLHIWDHNIHYFLDTWFSFLGRRRIFSPLKFKMAGIDWWSFLFYYFFRVIFLFLFLTYTRMPFFLCLSAKEQKYFPLKTFSFIFTLGSDFTLHVNIDSGSENITIFSDCEKCIYFVAVFKVPPAAIFRESGNLLNLSK